jgi:hypothetical protein
MAAPPWRKVFHRHFRRNKGERQARFLLDFLCHQIAQASADDEMALAKAQVGFQCIETLANGFVDFMLDLFSAAFR